MDTSDIRKNLKIMLDGQPYIVVDFQFVKPGKGQAFTRCKLRNMETGSALERTFKSGEKLEPAEVEQQVLQYIYPDGDGRRAADRLSGYIHPCSSYPVSDLELAVDGPIRRYDLPIHPALVLVAV